MIQRTRLIEQLVDPTRQYWLIEAGAGFGKSVLVDDLRRNLVASLIVVRPPISDRGKLSFLAELAEAAGRAGHPEEAAAIVGAEGNPALIADALATSDRSLAIDDIHEWDEEVAVFAVELLDAVRDRFKVVFSGRFVPAPIETLRTSRMLNVLGPRELSFTVAEIAELLDEDEDNLVLAKTLHDLSDGWPIAVAAAAARMVGVEDQLVVVQELGRHENMIDGLFQDQLDGLSEPDRVALRSLASLPFFDAGIAERLGPDGLIDRLAAAGVPILRRADGWSEVSGQFRASLARIGGPATAMDRDVVEHYVDRGEIRAAINVCLSAGEYEMAADILAGLSNDQQTRLDPSTVNAAITTLGEAVRTAPRCLLIQAQVNASFGRVPEGFEALEHARQIWKDTDPAMRQAAHRELLLELALWRANTGQIEGSQELLDAVIPLIDEERDEDASLRARIHDVKGILYHLEGSAHALEKASHELTEALRLWRGLSEPRAAAVTAFRLTAGVLADRARRSEALDLLDSLSSVGPMTLLNRARLGLERSLLLPYLGRAREVSEVLVEPRRIGHLLGHEWLVGWTYWSEIVAASFRYDADEVERLIEVFDKTGYVVIAEINNGLLWCDAAEALARCERFESARVALGRAQEIEGLWPWYLAYIEASIDARCGDADRAVEQLDAVALMDGVDVDHFWRIELLRAFALWRGGHTAPSVAALERTIDLARELGQSSLPDIVEGRLIGHIQSSAAAAPATQPARALVEITLFGRFEVVANGAQISLPKGQVSTLAKVMIIGGGHLLLDQVIDALWPEASLDQGRKRLRNVLNRLRDAGVEMVERDGDSLHLIDGVSSDYQRALALAQAAMLPDASPDSLVEAIAANEPDLLPADRYSEWAEDARSDQRQRLIALLDLQAGAAEEAGDVETTVAALRRAHELDEWRSDRLAAAAELLRSEGREAAATALERGSTFATST